MSLLFRIVYAAHANGTHHKLALDALKRLSSPNAETWRRLFLKHAELYMVGSKDPDKKFKDFRNHVLHVEDNYWGGAPEKCMQWYDRLVQALKDQSWEEAVYCAGVLSHYYTDPIHPFHTAQSEEESNIHRAVEWSISKSYDELRKQGETTHANLAVVVPTGDNWLKTFAIDGAETSNRHYTALIAHYDFTLGVSNPPAGLTPRCQTIIAELLIYAAEGFARILDRAFSDAAVTPPDVLLTAETVIAGLKIPVKWVERKLADSEDRAAVRAMYDELNATGRVNKTLSEDDRTIRDLHEKEIARPRRAARAQARAERLERDEIKLQRAANRPATSTSTPTPPPAPAGSDASEASPVKTNARSAVVDTEIKTARAEQERPHASPATSIDVEPVAPDTPDIGTDTGTVTAFPAHAQRNDTHAPRAYLELHDDLVDAPSIGPKTAQRFYDIGVSTVADFLDEEPTVMAELLDTRHITTVTLEAWQDQARLVMEVPGLRGTHAQLLQGAGYTDAESIADADPGELSAAVLTYATSGEGKRILRDGDPPDIEKIKSWVENAKAALAA